MSKFTLVITPDGKGLLTTPQRLAPEERAVVGKWIDEWQGRAGALGGIDDCEVVQVSEVEIDLDAEAVPA